MSCEDPILVYTREAVRRVDADAMSHYGMHGIVLMENAARGAARLANGLLAPLERPARILVACGTGNNGGDGWAAARHMANRGHDVRIAALGPSREGSDAAVNARIATAMQLPVDTNAALDASGVDLVIDALLGTGLDRDVTGRARNWIEVINAQPMPVLAMDLPSGLDADTGRPLGAAIEADCTATFVGWKQGFLNKGATTWLGRVEVIDIGVPRLLKERYGQPMST